MEKCFLRNEREKKQKYSQRVLEIENGSFTPLVFDTNGAMGRECARFYKRLAEMLAEKKHMKFSEVSSSIRTKIAFSLLKSTIRCVRGSKTLQNNNMNIEMSEDNNFVISQE